MTFDRFTNRLGIAQGVVLVTLAGGLILVGTRWWAALLIAYLVSVLVNWIALRLAGRL